MRCAGFFHFDLHATVFRVYIVEYLFARLAVVHGDVAVEVFVDVYQRSYAAEAQAQVVKTGGAVAFVDSGGSFLEVGGVEEHYRAEVEVIAERAELVVNHRRVGLLAFYHGIIVGICHACFGIAGELHEAIHSEVAHYEGVLLGVKEQIVGVAVLSYGQHCCRRVEAVDV